MIRIGVPDLVSNSYFPALAAVKLGFFKEQGIDARIELLFPVTDAAVALREGRLDFLAGAAHAPLYAFPEWQGARLLVALSQNMYWCLIARTGLGIARGDLSALRDLTIGAAPGVGEGLRQLLVTAGVDLDAAGIRIAPVPTAGLPSVSFGVTAAEALADGRIDAFWANGMGSEVALRRGVGTLVVDARRDGGPGAGFTFPALSTTQRMLDEQPQLAEAAVRAIVSAQDALRAQPELARGIGKELFPEMEAGLISGLVERDLPYYDPVIGEAAVQGLEGFARRAGLLEGCPQYADVVATQFAPLWAADRRKELQ